MAFCNEHPDLSFCRVIQQEKGLYQIVSSEGMQQARVSGKFHKEKKFKKIAQVNKINPKK